MEILRTGTAQSSVVACMSLTLMSIVTSVLPAMGLEGSAHTIVSQPHSRVGLSIDLAGFTIERDRFKPNGRRYLLASHPATGIKVAIALEQVAGHASTTGCIEHLQQLQKGPAVSRGKDVTLSTTHDMSTLEYTLPRFQGVRLDQKSLYACMAEGNVYANIHVSKVQYTDADASRFQQLLTTLRLQLDPRPRMTAHQPNAEPLFSIETVRYEQQNETRTIAR
ncbi:MAG: hypothetical protein JSR62_06740 [Nitrospira sp.]|nr:hypothetical protein [Nitrospira sp.]